MPCALEIETAIRAAMLQEISRAAAIFVPPKTSRSYACESVGCHRPACAKNLCNAHYLRFRKGLPLEVPLRARKREDSCAQCGAKTGAKGGWGLCQKHYRQKRHTAIKGALVALFGNSCQMCNGKFPLRVYDFHHSGGKEESPSLLIVNASPERISKELEKCQLLCANCHRIEHNERI